MNLLHTLLHYYVGASVEHVFISSKAQEPGQNREQIPNYAAELPDDDVRANGRGD